MSDILNSSTVGTTVGTNESAPTSIATSATTNEAGSSTNEVSSTKEVSSTRPEWLPDKFKDPESLATSYKELEQKQSAIGEWIGAPDEYKYSGDGDEPDGVKLFKQVAKDHNLSQGAFDKIINSYIEKEKAVVSVQQKNLEQSILNIGGDRISKAKNQIKTLGFNEEQTKALSGFATNENNFAILETMLQKINTNVSPAGNVAPTPIDVDQAILDLKALPDYKTNRAKYYAKYQSLLKLKMQQGV